MEVQHILIPVLGACIIQLLNLKEAATLEVSKQPNFKDPVYWIPYLINPILAGFAGWVYFQQFQYNVILALQVGVSAPLIIKQIVNTLPKGSPA